VSSHNSLFTPTARAEIVARVEVGLSLADAAVASGVNVETARSWLARGRREYHEWALAIERARESATVIEPMGAEELKRHMAVMVRAGSVSAGRLLWEMIRADSEPKQVPAFDPLAEVDALAARRAADLAP
jgi:transposase-like protein